MSKNKAKVKKKTFRPSFDWWHVGIIIAVALVLYGRTISFDYVVDDSLVVVENDYVNKGLSGLGDIFSHSYLQGFNQEADASYRPLPLATYALEKSISNKPAIHHFFQVIFYILTLMIWYLVLMHFFPDHRWKVLAVILLFATHPLHTEVVANIKSRDEILAALFAGLASLSYLKYIDSKKVSQLVLSLTALFFGLLSKESLVTFFVVFPLVAYYFKNQGVKKSILQALPFLGITFLYLLIRLAVLEENQITLNYIDNVLLAAENLQERIGTTLYLMGLYVWKIIYPVHLSYDYSFQQVDIVGIGNPLAILSFLGYVGMLGYALFTFRKKSVTGFGIIFFLITIVISLNILVLIGTTFAERLTFLPLMGWCIIIVHLADKYLSSIKLKYGLLGMIVLLYSVRTIVRTGDWKNDDTIFASGILTSPKSARTNAFYGFNLYDNAKDITAETAKATQLQEAKKYLQKSIDISGDLMASQHFMGFVLKEENNYQEAAQYFQRAVDLKPDFKVARENLALMLYQSDQFTESIEEYKKLYAEYPRDFDILNNYGLVLLKAGKYQDAEKILLEAFAIDQNNRNVIINLVRLYRDGLKDLDEAKKFNELLR